MSKEGEKGMEDKKKLQEIEKLLKELKAAESESAVTVEEVVGRKRKVLATALAIQGFPGLEEIYSATSGAPLACRHFPTVHRLFFIETRKHLHGTEGRLP